MNIGQDFLGVWYHIFDPDHDEGSLLLRESNDVIYISLCLCVRVWLLAGG